MDEFKSDLAENLRAVEVARTALLEQLRTLQPDDLRSTRRGGWSVQEVLRHVIDAEVSYTKVIGYLRSSPVDLPNATDEDVASPKAAEAALARARERLLALIQGVDEPTFYDLRALGKEQYSVVSVLENVASHDHEHLEQITKTLASARV
ncbi:MAG: DinB family protein [Dehalococcoidia bacterium]